MQEEIKEAYSRLSGGIKEDTLLNTGECAGFLHVTTPTFLSRLRKWNAEKDDKIEQQKGLSDRENLYLVRDIMKLRRR